MTAKIHEYIYKSQYLLIYVKALSSSIKEKSAIPNNKFDCKYML